MIMTAKQFRIGLNCLGHTKKLVAVKFAYERFILQELSTLIQDNYIRFLRSNLNTCTKFVDFSTQFGKFLQKLKSKVK